MRITLCVISFCIVCSCTTSPQQLPTKTGIASEEDAWLSVIPAAYHDEFRVWFENDSNRKKITVENNCEEISNVDFRDQLLILSEKDQKVRQTIPIDFEAMQLVDRENSKAAKLLLNKYDWPEFCDVGLLGFEALWLLVQHSSDQELIELGMAWLEKFYNEGKILGQQYAYSYDRFMRVNKGLPQKYGTQTQCDKSTNKAVFLPIEDQENIEELRNEVGLIPLEMYLAVINDTDRSCDVK